jgi:hypothetical protein
MKKTCSYRHPLAAIDTLPSQPGLHMHCMFCQVALEHACWLLRQSKAASFEEHLNLSPGPG